MQVTIGCSWNRCTYCSMYTAPQKKFRPRAEDDVLQEIRRCGVSSIQPRRVFLADGDGLDTLELCREIRTFINATELKNTIFRSDHASNHLVLKGVLGKDKVPMLENIDQAIDHFEQHPQLERGQVGY